MIMEKVAKTPGYTGTCLITVKVDATYQIFSLIFSCTRANVTVLPDFKSRFYRGKTSFKPSDLSWGARRVSGHLCHSLWPLRGEA